jgi:hypothetical protein
VTRYDTRSSFTAATSWSTFDTTGVSARAKGFSGAVFDGRFLYLVPTANGELAGDGVVARYDTQAAFGAAASWAVFDAATVDPNAKSYAGGAFDGRYVYFVPGFGNSKGTALRYDTQAPFGTASSWSTFMLTALDPGAWAYVGAVFDGRYVYLVPFGDGGLVARYDISGDFASAASWTVHPLGNAQTGVVDYATGIFDGRYVYFVPLGSFGSFVVRYDTLGGFADPASWTQFDVTSVNAAGGWFASGSFDGRYAYFVPIDSSRGPGYLARFDTTTPFSSVGSWTTFVTTDVSGSASGFEGVVYDGRYLYLVPYVDSPENNHVFVPDGLVARFDTKTPPSMPGLPGFSGSFY